MAQHDYNIANQSGADFRSDLNNALSAIASTNSGDTSPTTTFANQLWIDTANNVLKIRNEGNSAWITTGISITADNTFNIDGGTVNGITALSFSSGSSVTTILDEDNLASNSATALATQQSIKAYVDSQVGSVDTLAEILTNGNTTGGTDISLSSSDIIGTGNINITGTIQSSGAITGNLTGNVTGNVTGNASTATALQTARTINGASFDGTANISFNTDSVSEGSSNLYFTNARVESYLDAGSATPTFASAVINSSLTGSAILDDDTFGTASATTVATSESIKAYVDSQVATKDTLAEVLAGGNTTGGTDISLSSSNITGTGNIDITGTITADGVSVDGNINLGDNDSIYLGDSNDLRIYHDSGSSLIRNTTGNLYIQDDNGHVYIRPKSGQDGLVAIADGAVTLHHSGNAKIATTSSGIDVTGRITTDGLTTSADINFGDDDKALFGAGNDLKIYHSANNQSYIHEAGTGDLNILASNFRIQNGAGTENKIVANTDGAVTLYYDNSAKLATTSTGIDVTGTVTANGGLNSNHAIFSGQASRGLKISTEVTTNNDDTVAYDAQTSTGQHLFKTGGTEKARLDTSGNFLVGGTSVSQDDSFAVSQTGKVTIAKASSGSAVMASFKNGGTSVGTIVTTTTSTAYNTSSDARLKEVTGEARGLEVINKLNPVAYNWKSNGQADEGLLAQEVKELVPNAVTGSEDEHYQMDYSKLVTHLVKGMKEQQEQIESLKSEIANLKGEI